MGVTRITNLSTSRSFNQGSYEILLHLPFVPSIVIRHVITADTLISDLHLWFTLWSRVYIRGSSNIILRHCQLLLKMINFIFAKVMLYIMTLVKVFLIYVPINRFSLPADNRSVQQPVLCISDYFLVITFPTINWFFSKHPIPGIHKPDANIWTQSFDRDIQAG